MTGGTGAVSNVSSAVLLPRIPHVDSTTMLIARLARGRNWWSQI